MNSPNHRLFLVLCLYLFVGNCRCDLYRALDVAPDASDAEIKKSYRRLALELHPDKIPANCSEEEKEQLTLKFIEVQNAYETLGNAESRLRYDLGTQGIEYSVRESKEKERYTSGPFELFAKSKHAKIMFQANFKKKAIPDISINVAISARDIFNITSGNVSFYRSVKCKSCGGNGGLNGTCETCPFCNGHGAANHIFRDKTDSFAQMTKTECGVCGGRGCMHNHGQCSYCKGTGFVMDLTSIAYSLPKGFADGSEIPFAGIGHEDLDGEVGSVKLKFMIAYPPLWSVESPLSLNLVYTMYVKFKDIEKGLVRKIVSISGEELLVEHDVMDLLTVVTGGVSDIVIPEKGLYGADGVTRGDVIVKITVTYEELSTEDVLSSLKITDSLRNDGIFGKLFDVLRLCTDDDSHEACQANDGGERRKPSFTTSSDDVSFV